MTICFSQLHNLSTSQRPKEPAEMSHESKRKAGFPRLWYQAKLEQQADHEKARLAWLQRIEDALTILAERYGWEVAYLFGSIAEKGKFRTASDIDIALKGLSKLDYYKFVGEISDILEKRVDVVLLEECHFADSIREKGIKWSRKSKS
jgi:predicted nucleotidyltransferase